MNSGDITPILSRLDGSILAIPSLDPLYSHWKSGLNPHYERLIPIVDCMLEKSFQDALHIQRLKSMDFALCASLCYPDAEWERLRVGSIYLLWLFLWDDEIDKKIDPNTPDCASNATLAENYRSQSLAFIQHALGTNGDLKCLAVNAPTAACSLLSEVVPSVTEIPGQVDVSRLAEDLDFMVLANGIEQRLRLSGRFPTMEEYLDFRRGTGSVDAICSINQYVACTNLPAELAWSDEVTVLRRETNFGAVLSNDLYSLKKEIEDVTPISAVPILIHETGRPLEAIVSDIVDQLRQSVRNFDAAAASLRLKGLTYGLKVGDDLEKFIAVFETFQTGCIAFYVTSQRYNISQYRQTDGSYLIPL